MKVADLAILKSLGNWDFIKDPSPIFILLSIILIAEFWD